MKKLFNKHKLLLLSYVIILLIVLLLCTFDTFKIFFLSLFEHLGKSFVAGCVYSMCAFGMEALLKYSIRYRRFEKGYNHLMMGCDHFQHFDAVAYTNGSDCWPTLHNRLKYVTPLKKERYYKGNYNYIWDNHMKLVYDVSHVLWHMSQEMDYLNEIRSWSIIERSNIKMLYENEYVERDIIVQKRWKFFIDNMNKGENRDELIELYNERFKTKSKVKQSNAQTQAPIEHEIPNHLDNDLIDEVLKR